MGNMVSAYGEIPIWSRLKDALLGFAFLAVMTVATGSSAADESVNFLYHPAGLGKGGSGDLYFGQKIQPLAGRPQVLWIVGEIRNGSGEKTGNILSAIPPVDTVMDAFSQELKGAGYNVIPCESLPEKVSKGIRLTSVSIRLEETDKIYKVESKCTVKVSLEPWINGAPVRKLDYVSSQEESTVLDRDMILLKSEQEALHHLLARAVREVIDLLERK